MSFLFRLRCLNLFIKVVFPDRNHLAMPMASTPVPKRWKRPPGGIPDFVEDLTEDEIGICNGAFRDAWGESLEDPDVIANTRAFLIHQWNHS
jgi:hypothetical protein